MKVTEAYLKKLYILCKVSIVVRRAGFEKFGKVWFRSYAKYGSDEIILPPQRLLHLEITKRLWTRPNEINYAT